MTTAIAIDTPWDLLVDDYCDAWNRYARVMGFLVHYEEDPEEKAKLRQALAGVRLDERLSARNALAAALRSLIRYDGPDGTRERRAALADVLREGAAELDQPWLGKFANAIAPPE